MNGILHKDLRKSIAESRSTSFDELLYRFDKYIVQEEFEMVVKDNNFGCSKESNKKNKKCSLKYQDDYQSKEKSNFTMLNTTRSSQTRKMLA